MDTMLTLVEMHPSLAPIWLDTEGNELLDILTMTKREVVQV